MSGNIMIPALGESISEATIAKWHKKSGDAVKADTVLLEIETDKVTLEVHAPADGILEKILIQEGAVVKVGQVVGLFEIKALTANETNLTDSSTVHDKSPIGSPAAIKIAAEAKIALSTVSGTGKDGRVTKGDMLQAVELCTQVHQPSIDNNLHEHEKSHTSFDGCDHRHETRVKMTKLRRTIAMRLKESQNIAAILTTFNEVDMSEIKRIREKYKEKFQKKHGTKLGLMSFFIKAAVQALQEFPAVNASIDGEDILYKSYYDIGVAIGTESGLVVPVLRNADKLSFAETEKAIAFLSSKAKENKLSISDMSGGSFSITNGGIYGSMLSTPIINPPQSAILGMHSVVERPHAVAGVLEIRPIMYLALSYDHRLIDGKEAVMFLIRIKEIVENPEIILFDI